MLVHFISQLQQISTLIVFLLTGSFAVYLTFRFSGKFSNPAFASWDPALLLINHFRMVSSRWTDSQFYFWITSETDLLFSRNLCNFALEMYAPTAVPEIEEMHLIVKIFRSTVMPLLNRSPWLDK